MGTAIGELIEKEELELSSLSGRTVGVDSYNIIYQFLSSIRAADGTPLMDSRGNVTSHLTGLLYRTTNLLEKGIKPVFVFDGKPPRFKKKTQSARAEIKKTAEEATVTTAQELREALVKSILNNAAPSATALTFLKDEVRNFI